MNNTRVIHDLSARAPIFVGRHFWLNLLLPERVMAGIFVRYMLSPEGGYPGLVPDEHCSEHPCTFVVVMQTGRTYRAVLKDNSPAMPVVKTLPVTERFRYFTAEPTGTAKPLSDVLGGDPFKGTHG